MLPESNCGAGQGDGELVCVNSGSALLLFPRSKLNFSLDNPCLPGFALPITGLLPYEVILLGAFFSEQVLIYVAVFSRAGIVSSLYLMEVCKKYLDLSM